MAKLFVHPKKSRFRGTKPFGAEILLKQPNRASTRPQYNKSKPLDDFDIFTGTTNPSVSRVKAHPIRRKLIKGAKAVGNQLSKAPSKAYAGGQFVTRQAFKGYKGGHQFNKLHRQNVLAKLQYQADKEELRAKRQESKLRSATAPEAIQSREREYQLQREVLGDISSRESNLPQSLPIVPPQRKRIGGPFGEGRYLRKSPQRLKQSTKNIFGEGKEFKVKKNIYGGKKKKGLF